MLYLLDHKEILWIAKTTATRSSHALTRILKNEAYIHPAPFFRYNDSGFYVIFNFEKISIEQKVLELIKEDPKITVVRISEVLAVNSRTILRTLKVLREHSIIERIGNNRSGEWKIL